jgi:hypothetical protein
MKVVETPEQPWLAFHYRCPSCHVIVQMEPGDRRDSAWMRRQKPDGTYTIRARCAYCLVATGWFTQVQEANDERD